MTPLEPILKAASANQTITLPRGVYSFGGCKQSDPQAPVLPAGAILDGQGSIIMVSPEPNSKTDAIRGAGKNTVRNLHIQIQDPLPGDTGKRNGVILRVPGRNSIDHVTVSGLYGTRKASQEAFGLVAIDGLIRRSSVVQNRSLAQSGADYVSAICGPAISIYECSVIWPDYDWDAMPFWASYNIQDAYQLTMDRCRSFGGRDAVYSDWGNTRQVSISRCEFMHTVNGLHLQAQNRDGLAERVVDGVRMSHSLVHLAPNRSNGRHPSCGLLVDSTGLGNSRRLIRNVIARNCQFTTSGDHTESCYYAANVASDHPVTQDTGISGVQIDLKEFERGFLVRNKLGKAGMTILSA